MMKEYKKISRFILYLLLIFIISLNSQALPEPEAWLKFDGNTADCTGNGYHGIPDSPQQFTEDFDQNTNSAYHFSSGQNISLGDKFNMDTDNFTITLWFKTDKEMSSTMQLVGKTNDTYYISPGGQGFFLGLRQYSGVDRVITQVRGDNGAREMYSPEIDETRWHFVALRRGTGSLSLFVDGHEPIVNDLSAGSISSPGTEFSIGRDAGWQGSFVGAMDDLRIYKEALTDEEINEIYKEGWPSDFPPYLNSISTSTERGQAPLTVDLSAETEDFDDETLYYTWDFGDGNISTESPSHIYQNPGVYTVSLTVSDDEGRDDSASISIRVDGDNSGVIHAASCSYQDVSAAVAAADPGETVRVPAGEAVWEKRLELGKSIRLIGAGIDRTTLINGIQSDGTNDYIIKITPENPEEDPFIEVAGFTLDANKEGGAVSISSTDDEYPYYNFRVHHNKIMNGYDTGQSYMAVRVKGNCFGLIDHNILLNNLRDFKLYGDDKNSWDKFPGVDNIGSRNYLYIENNKSERYISFPGQEFTVTSGEGSRWVFRYNQLDLTVRGFGTFDAHGNTNNNGVVAHEIYENTIVNAQDRGDGFRFHDLRGGTGIIFNNTGSGDESGTGIDIREEDGKNPNCSYPGKQTVNNTYLWNNNYNDNPMSVSVKGNEHVLMLDDQRDFWTDYLEGRYNEYFAKGLSSERPDNPIDGDCYWETDNRKLYRSVGDNNWELVYEPYTYPHPLSRTSPAIIKQPLSKTINRGGNITFSVEAYGYPELQYQWYFNDSKLEEKTSSLLTLNNVQEENIGDYSVEISNGSERIKSENAVLTLIESLPEVTNLIYTVEYYTSYISWQNPSNQGDDWDGIRVIRKEGSRPANPDDGIEIYNGISNKVVDKDLTEGSYYYAVYTYEKFDNNTVFSAPVIVSVPIPALYSKNHLKVSAGQQNDSERIIRIGQNTRGDIFTLWNTESNIIGIGSGGNKTDLWVYKDLIGSSQGQIPQGNSIESARLVFNVEDYSFNTDNNIAHSIEIYRIIDPDNLGTPHFAEESGFRVGLDFNYRDHRPGINKRWISSVENQNQSGNILELLNNQDPVDIIEFYPVVFEESRVDTIKFDITKAVQAWADEEAEHGLYITAGQGWDIGEKLTFYGVTADEKVNRPYIEIIYEDSNGNFEPPEPVQDICFIPGASSVELNWINPELSDPVNNNFAGIKIVREEGIVPFTNQDGETAVFIPSSENTYTDQGLVKGKVYYYSLYTYDDFHNYSEEVWIKAIPGSPEEAPTLQTPIAGQGTVELRWNNISGADGYRIYSKDSLNNTLLIEVDQSQEPSLTDYVFEGEYTYWVTAVNGYGEGPTSEKRDVAVCEASSTPPTVPADFEGQAISGSEIQLGWQDNSNEVFYVIERRNIDRELEKTINVLCNSTGYIDYNLQPETVYYYSIKAVNSAGEASSEQIRVTTGNKPVSVRNLIWEVISASQIKVQWDDTPNEDYYRIELFDIDNKLLEILDLSINTDYYYFVNLEPGKKYRVKITSINSNGEISVKTDIIRTAVDPKGGLF